MAKPTDVPIWATAGGTDAISGQNNLVEPPTDKQAAGWHYLEKLPRNLLNWWMNRVGQWTSYIDNLVSENLTWSGLQTFQNTPQFTETIKLAIFPGQMIDAGDAGWDFNYFRWITNSGSASGKHLICPLSLKAGDLITAVDVYYDIAASTVSAELVKIDMGDGSETAISDSTVSVGTGFVTTSLTNIVSDPVSDEDAYYVVMNPNTTGTGRHVRGIVVTLDRPHA